MRDLEFNLHARDKTAAAFDAARQRAREFNGDLDRNGRSFDAAASRARNYAAAMRSGGHETANLAAQLNDIGVSLAGGQSPLLVAVQQGTQINQILGNAGAAGAVAMLRGAFVSLLNPVSLATIALIGGGGYVVQYFTEMLTGAESAEDVLKREAELIQHVVDKWGDAVPSLRAYLAERQKLNDQEALGDATKAAVADQYGAAREQVRELKLSIVDVVDQLREFGASDDQIVAVQRAFSDLEDKVRDNSATAADANRVQAALMGLYINTGVDAVGDLAREFFTLSGAISSAAQAAATFKFDRSILDFNSRNPLGGLQPITSGGGRFLNPAELQDWRAQSTKSKFQQEQEALLRRTSSEAAREQESAYEKVIQRLAEEQELLGLNATEQRILVEQRRAGVSATSAEGRAIAEKIRAIEAERAALQDLKDQQEAMNEAAEYLGEVGFDALEAIITQSDSASDAVKRLGLELLKAAAYALLFNEGPLAGLFSGWSLGGGGGSGIITDLKTPALSNMAGIGTAMLASAKMVAGGGGAGASVVKVELSKDLVARVISQADSNAVQIASGAIADFAPTIPDRIADYQRDPRRR